MVNPPEPRRNSPVARALALLAGVALLLVGVVLLWHGIDGFIDEATSGAMSGRDAAGELLVVAAGGVALVLALAAARVGEVI